MLLLLATLFLLGGSSRSQPIRAVDFRNRAYSLARPGQSDLAVLKDGRYKFAADPEVAPGVQLVSVRYGDLDRDGQEEALVVLRYDNAGSAMHYDYLFVFRMGADGPKVWYSNQYESAESIVLAGNAIVVKAPLWLSRDAHCCPTYDAQYTIRSSAGVLRVVAKRLHRNGRSS